MSEYIEKEKTKVIVCDSLELYTSEYDILCDAIDNIPPDDVAPVVHGNWIGKPISGYCNVRCSKCGEIFYSNGKWHYCPECGAKMDL